MVSAPVLPTVPGPPSPALTLLELRALPELAASLASWPLLQQAARGDGHPVLVFPGLAGTDLSTALLRVFLADRGWDVHGWALGRNRGYVDGVQEQILERVRSLREASGRAVSLVGLSLGGLYARQAAAAAPDLVRTVVTLGATLRGHPRATHMWPLYELASGRSVDDEARLLAPAAPPAEVPTTSIFSRSDGLVAWQACVEPPGDRRESIEVVGSHSGYAVNAAALHAVADRLALPEGGWAPFDRTGWRALLYPDPHRPDPWSQP